MVYSVRILLTKTLKMKLEICKKMDDFPEKINILEEDKDLFFQVGSNITIEESKNKTSVKENDKILNILQNMPVVAQSPEFLPEGVQNCIEIASSNVISIPEDQIVKIQYAGANGIVNTEYIVNEELLQAHLNTNYGEEQIIYTSTNDGCDSSMYEEIQIERIDEIEMQNSSILSPNSESDEISETDLTSLNWLHNITNIMSVPNLPTPPVSPKPKKTKSSSSGQEDLTININYYKKNGDKKPPFSYATLICMAMGKNGNKMTLSAIYRWIRDNFLYYQRAHPSWQVSPNSPHI